MNDHTAYPTKKNISGVYEIYCTTNNERYIGSAECLRHRRNDHRSYLRRGIHPNIHLQRAWDLYGESSFEWRVLEFCLPDMCLEREQYWIDTLKPKLNIALVAGSPMKGRKKSTESVEKGAAKIRGTHQSEEHRRKRSEALKGRKRTEQERQSISEGTKQRTPKGEANAAAKLTMADVSEIRRLYATGQYSHPQLGRMFNVGHTTIGRIVRGELWKHIL